MKSSENATPKRRPYDAPVLTRQNNLKSITLFTSYGSGDDNNGGGGGSRYQESR